MNILAGLLAVLIGINTANAKTFQYLYLEANEGTASGGHVALQFQDTVFHYQFSNGLLRLAKDDGENFDFDYRYLQNRNLHVADIEVSDDTYAKLQDDFQRRFWDQDRQFKHLQALENDRLLLAWFLKLTDSPQTSPQTHESLSLPAAGLFYSPSDFDKTETVADPCQTDVAATQVIGLLRRQLEQQYGVDFLSQRIQSLTQAIHQIAPPSTDNLSGLSSYTFSQHYLDLLNGLLAIQAVQSSRPLAPTACHTLATNDGQLNAQQSRVLQGYRQLLLQSSKSLLTSKRPDWGQALFVTLARLVATEQSLVSGQWVFLDDFSPTATLISTEQYRNQAEAMQQQFLAAEQRWRQRWQSLNSDYSLDDLGYTDLELAANRYHEWQTSQSRHSLRYQGQQPLPLKPLPLSNWVLPKLSSQQLQQSLQTLQNSLPGLVSALNEQYAYQLVSRNCVTELFQSINQALGSETEQRLGSVINPNLNIVPFTAFASVQQYYPVNGTRLLPSFRQQQLAKQYAKEFEPWVFARESNVLTSELYHYNPDDAVFMFFTDDSVLLRPLFGAFNTLTGLGQSVWGLLQLPVDQGAALQNGTRGLLMSLPELAFINIRKGSYKFGLPEQRSPVEASP